MSNFRRKREGIEANQYFPKGHEKHMEIPGVIHITQLWGSTPYWIDGVETLGHNIKLWPGDWVVIDENGQTWVCKPDVFDKLFEPVEEESFTAALRL